MISLIQKMPPLRFRLLGALFCALGDWILAIYVFLTLLRSREYLMRLLESVAQAKGISLESLPPELIEAFITRSTNLGTGAILFVLVFNLIFYVLFYKGKKGVVIFYIKSLAWLGAPFYLLFALSSLENPLLALLLFLQVFLYIFVILGLRNNQTVES